MAETLREDDRSACWQCGAPADASCAFVQALESPIKPASPGTPRFTLRIRRDTARISVPRCAACRDRNWVIGFGTVAAALFGAILATWIWPSRGWSMVAGAFAALIAAALAGRAYQTWRGFRLNTDYPPLRRLTDQGWTPPG